MIRIIDLYFCNRPQTIAAFLVETTEGPVLVETGPYSTLPALENALRQYGYSCSDVKHVLLTHIHLDHGGAAWFFAEQGARIYLHPAGCPHLTDPSRLLLSAQRIYGDAMQRLWGEIRPVSPQQLIPTDHQKKIQIGKSKFYALHTPGHAIHHIAWQYGEILFCGDIGGIRIGDNPVVVPPCPPPDIHIGEWLESLRLIRKKHLKELYLTHFGKVAQVKMHLNELENRLQNWANWMLPYYEQNVPAGEITPLFQDYVALQLGQAGVSEEDIAKYENANPSWMSVEGLLRYWRKFGKSFSSRE